MSNSKEKKATPESEASRYISDKATLDLWVHSGGRCAICNKFLLEEPYFERRINLAERAHIAGWSDAPGSPRGDSELPLAERGEVKNLILLCLEHHKMVDDKQIQGEYPEEELLAIKRSHEERIRHLTDMAHDRETSVLRVFGAVRGSIPEMARQEAMRTVVDVAGRYAKFPLSVDRHSIEINLAQLPEPDGEEPSLYWQMARKKIDDVALRISDAVHEKHIRHISVFALARISLLVYLGYVLDDKVPVDLYQKHRGDGEGWGWPEDDKAAVAFEIVEQRAGTRNDEVALVLSLSGTVDHNQIPADISDIAVFEIRPVGLTPNPNLFRSRATLDSFARVYQEFLARLEQTHKGATRIHLFPAVPITAAIVCGRSIMRDIHPALQVYEWVRQAYKPTIEINQK